MASRLFLASFFSCIVLLSACLEPGRVQGFENTESTVDSLSKAQLTELIRQAIGDSHEQWVAYANGSYVVFDPTTKPRDINTDALQIIKEYGPVYAGGPAGDFSVIKLENMPGWVVTSHHPQIFTYVHPSEVEGDNPDDLKIGLIGRSKRNTDSHKAEILFIQR